MVEGINSCGEYFSMASCANSKDISPYGVDAPLCLKKHSGQCRLHMSGFVSKVRRRIVCFMPDALVCI